MESLREITQIIQLQLQVMQADITAVRNEVEQVRVGSGERLAVLETNLDVLTNALDELRERHDDQSDHTGKIWLAVISALTSVALAAISIFSGRPPAEPAYGPERPAHASPHE